MISNYVLMIKSFFIQAIILTLASCNSSSQQEQRNQKGQEFDSFWKDYKFSLQPCTTGAIYSKVKNAWIFGTGFILKDSSTIVTAYHLVENSDSILFICDKKYLLSILAEFPALDIAILKSPYPISQPLKFDLDILPSVNDSIVIIGIENNSRMHTDGNVLWVKAHDSVLQPYHLIRFKSISKKGYSGGPILNMDGKVIGIILRGIYRDKVTGLSEGTAISIDFIKFVEVPWKN